MSAPLVALVFLVGMGAGAAVMCLVLFAALHGVDCPCSECRYADPPGRP